MTTRNTITAKRIEEVLATLKGIVKTIGGGQSAPDVSAAMAASVTFAALGLPNTANPQDVGEFVQEALDATD